MKTIRQMLKWAVQRGLTQTNPSPGYRLPPAVKSKAEAFSADLLAKILEAAEEPFKDVFDFFRLTGLRNDELCWLFKSDVDPKLQFVHIREKTCPFTGETWRPKHGNERSVPLCAAAAEIAKRHVTSDSGPWLFCAPDTSGRRPGQFKKARIWRALKAILKNLGVSRGTVHTFRHCFCSFLANQNVSPFLVMKFMGHSSLDIVMTYYHAGSEDLLSGMAAVKFERMLGEQEHESSDFSANRTTADPARDDINTGPKEC